MTGHAYRFVIHDWDSIFSKELDEEVTAMGVRVLRTPVRAPKANSVCERFGGTLRRECLDFLIPLNECHLNLTLKLVGQAFQPRQTAHESGSRDTDATLASPAGEWEPSSHPSGHVIRSTAVLGGLHHEYALEKTAA